MLGPFNSHCPNATDMNSCSCNRGYVAEQDAGGGLTRCLTLASSSAAPAGSQPAMATTTMLAIAVCVVAAILLAVAVVVRMHRQGTAVIPQSQDDQRIVDNPMYDHPAGETTLLEPLL